MCAHTIQGIGDGFIPEIVDTNLIDQVVKVKSKDAITMTKRFIRELGMPVGIFLRGKLHCRPKSREKAGQR